MKLNGNKILKYLSYAATYSKMSAKKYCGISEWWQNLSVTKKLYGIVGVMALLIASELLTLMFAMSTLSAVRAFVAGEGLWTKAQKDAIHGLYQYAISGDEKHYDNFKENLVINEGDHIALIEMSKGKEFDRQVVRKGFMMGGNHPKDVDGMINLLTKYYWVGYISDAIEAWTSGDRLLEELKKSGEDLHQSVQKKLPRAKTQILNNIARINSELTIVEINFSKALGAGSRWLENLLLTILLLLVATIEGTGIYLTYRFSRNLSMTLKNLADTAAEVGRGNFSKLAPVNSKDELGQLAMALNTMAADLQANAVRREQSEDVLRASEEKFRLLAESVKAERKDAEQRLYRLNESLEKRFESRTSELQDREYQMRIVTNALPVLIAQIDIDEKIIFSNEKFAEWVESSTRTIIGQSLQQAVGSERYSVLKGYIKKALDGETVSFERSEKFGENTSFETFLNITFVPEKDMTGKVTSFILVANDVTKYKEIESELTNAKEQADVASSTKSAFLANMSHEIRTPLGAILSFSELLLGQELTGEERVRGVEIIKRNGFLLSNIINDILDLSKVEAGKLDIERLAVHFDEVVSEIKSLLNLKATEKGIRLSVTADGAIPDVIVTDPLRLRQILLNIVGNAIKFTQQGSVDIKISLVSENSGAPKLRFLVKDTGKGIKPAHAKKLFEPFSQEDVSTTRKFGGTGLGLVLSKKLANSLGGDVVLLSSKPNQGSTFSITIDPGDLKKVLFQNFETRPVDAAPVVGITADFSRVKILLVDDSLDNQLIVTHLLRTTGAKIETANNGREGVDKAKQNNYDLILMDLQMPVLDGYGAIQELKQSGYRKPIIALTAHAMKEERVRCLESGFIDHLSKPVDRHLLIKVIDQYTKTRGEISATL